MLVLLFQNLTQSTKLFTLNIKERNILWASIQFLKAICADYVLTMSGTPMGSI